MKENRMSSTRYFLTAILWTGLIGVLWTNTAFGQNDSPHVDYERFLLQRMMIAKVRQYNGESSASMLLQELRKEAKRNGITIPAWAKSGSSKKLIRYRPRHQRCSLNQYNELIMKASRTHRLSPALIKAVIKVESGFVNGAISHAGAQGLMQLMPDTAKDLEVFDAFDPKANIFGGTRLLRRHIDEFGSLKKALIAYNAGPDVISKGLKIPRETREYMKKVIHYYHIYKK
ncbi:MAG: lytic transglycosylase domain-containing protein [Deltaproteobacteria bacterium]|nr:lytic transglycosylase domain-containing protein [Deltaproteobacteria bacterium]